MQLSLTCSKSTIETQQKSVEYIQSYSNNKNIRTALLMSFWFWCFHCLLGTCFRPFSSFSIVDIKQINTCLEVKGIFRILSNIIDEAFFAKIVNVQRFSTINIICEKALSQIVDSGLNSHPQDLFKSTTRTLLTLQYLHCQMLSNFENWWCFY